MLGQWTIVAHETGDCGGCVWREGNEDDGRVYGLAASGWW